MKRFLSMIVAVCAFFAASAQTPMVTLSHNGELSFFTNLTAFESAYDSAVNGDTIYLSHGEFILTGGAFTIKKRLCVIGNGYGSHIMGNLTINMQDNPNSVIEAPLFDGVRLDKLEFFSSSNGSSINNLDTSEIRRCWIRSLVDGGNAGNNVTFDKCYIEDADFNGSGTVMVKNSKLNCSTSRSNYIGKVTAINSNIILNGWYPLNAISCILKKGSNNIISVYSTSASVIYSLLDFQPTNQSSLYTDSNYVLEDASNSILDDKLDCTLNLSELGYLGQDGKVVGIMGGDSPYSENPSMPSVDTDKSSVEYDAAGNKLKVSITVKAD